MRCPACKQYVPDGLGLLNCPNCDVELPAITLSLASAPPESGKPVTSHPRSQAQTPSIQKNNPVNRFLFDFGYKRSLREAVGFWIFYTLVGAIIAILIGVVEYALFKRHVSSVLGIRGSNFLGAAECLLLSVLILRNKARTILNCLITVIALLTALYIGPSFGILLIAFLTMQRSCKDGTSSEPGSKLPVIFISAGVLLVFACIAAVHAYREGLGFHSYYIDDDQAARMSIPDNQYFQFHSKFFILTLQYPQDMYRSVLGREFFLKKSGATHFSQLSVQRSAETGLPVRFRVKSFELNDGNHELPFLLYQPDLYNDKLQRLTAGKPPSEKDARLALDQSAELLSKLDFSETYSAEELFFGYFLTKPPKKLRLLFEIEVYALGGEPKQIVAQSIELNRVDKDPHEWVKNIMKNR